MSGTNKDIPSQKTYAHHNDTEWEAVVMEYFTLQREPPCSHLIEDFPSSSLKCVTTLLAMSRMLIHLTITKVSSLSAKQPENLETLIWEWPAILRRIQMRMGEQWHI